MGKKFEKLLLIVSVLVIFISCETDYDTLKVVYCRPGGNETGILSGSTIEIRFSSAVKMNDVEDSFSLTNGDGSVNGNFSWLSGDRFIYTPDEPMSVNGRYVIELPRSIRDKDGNTMESDFISEFYIGSDFSQPVISSSVPASSSGALTNISVNQNIIINFTKSMNRESVEKNFSITPDAGGYFYWSESTPGLQYSRLEYIHINSFEYGKLYTFKLSSTAEDVAGNSLGLDYRVNFITGEDFIPPSVQSIYDNAAPGISWDSMELNSGVSKNVIIGVTFSKPMDRQSVEKAFSITPQVQGNFEWNGGNSISYRPVNGLSPEARYQVSIDTVAKDINGLKLSGKYTVEIFTNADDSLLIRTGKVLGSNHDGDFTVLAAAWPYLINMGSGNPVNKNYYIEIEFLSDAAGTIPASMNRYSIYDNLIVETFKSTSGSGEMPDSARIGDVVWITENIVKIRIDGMTNKSSGQMPALYRLTVAGGENGIKDRNGNYMKKDFVIEIREAIP